jgi:hypothetical protein
MMATDAGIDVSRPAVYMDEEGKKVQSCSPLYLAMLNNKVQGFQTLLDLVNIFLKSFFSGGNFVRVRVTRAKFPFLARAAFLLPLRS